MRRPLLIAGSIAGVLCVVGVLVGVHLKRAIRQPQPFYAAALAVEHASLEQASHSFERRVATLYSDWQLEPQWQAAFSINEINGWLAVALPNKHPDLLPKFVTDPRIAIRDGRLHLGFQWQDQNLASPISLEIEVFATESDLLAVRFCRARAGSLPLPMKRIIEHATRAAKKLNWAVRWTRHRGDPVALAPLHGLVCGENLRRELEGVKISDGEIVLWGGAVRMTAALPPPRSATDSLTR